MAPATPEPLSPLTLRTARGESRNAVAKAIGVSQQALHRYEDRDRTPPADVVVRLAEHYGLGPAQGWALMRWWAE